jgi:UDP-N-acetyl-2-amino-2-deoxyglucuronate dehydrogenase
MNNFSLIGAAGYIAPRHMKAISATKNKLVAALDKNDSVGIIDSYFPDADFFSEFERFDRHVEKLKRMGDSKRIHYVAITSPNYLHDAHTRFALRIGADAICEKPLVLNPWNVDALREIEKETGKRVYTILQLRLHPSIKALKERVAAAQNEKKFDIDLTYITSRGHWYLTSWKNDISKSGGIATNIGVHFFDMLTWIFGDVQHNVVHYNDNMKSGGFIEFENARVRWFLSIDKNDLPIEVQQKEQRTYRSILVSQEEIEFSEGFTDLHTMSYHAILKGKGFGLSDVKSSIEIVHNIRTANPTGLKGEYHPILRESLRV